MNLFGRKKPRDKGAPEKMGPSVRDKLVRQALGWKRDEPKKEERK